MKGKEAIELFRVEGAGEGGGGGYGFGGVGRKRKRTRDIFRRKKEGDP